MSHHHTLGILARASRVCVEKSEFVWQNYEALFGGLSKHIKSRAGVIYETKIRPREFCPVWLAFKWVTSVDLKV